jgi:type I thyroxine 5'-deiodinase
VYIQEAHPSDLWQMESNVREGVLFRSAHSDQERTATASSCVLLDGIDNRTERAYTGWPDRLFLIGTDGRVVFKTAPGPFGFSTRTLEHSLAELTHSASLR